MILLGIHSKLCGGRGIRAGDEAFDGQERDKERERKRMSEVFECSAGGGILK